jgi:hypothetical protein
VQQRRKRLSDARKPVVQAEAFEVVDQAGHVMARLGPVPGSEVNEPGTGLVLLDESGAPRLTLSLDASGPALHLIAGGTVRVSMAVVGSTAVVAVRDLNGTEAVTIAIGGTESR